MDRSERKEKFRAALIALVNMQIAETGITPEDAGAVLAEEGHKAMMCLPWMPHSQRAANEHFVCAAACLNDGRVIPVPGFEEMFPESELGDSVGVAAGEHATVTVNVGDNQRNAGRGQSGVQINIGRNQRNCGGDFCE